MIEEGDRFWTDFMEQQRCQMCVCVCRMWQNSEGGKGEWVTIWMRMDGNVGSDKIAKESVRQELR